MNRSFTVLLTLIVAALSDEICLTGDDEPYQLFGAKTAYEFANQGISSQRLHDVPGCRPIAIWLLVRHGSHNPEVEEIKDLEKLKDLKSSIINNYKNGNVKNSNERICSADINLLDNWEWSPHLNISLAGELTTSGYLSTHELARNWKSRYPGVLTDNRHDYVFKYLTDKRSNTSFLAFTSGLFQPQVDGYGIPKEHDEKLLLPTKYCPIWKDQVEDNEETLKQAKMFRSNMQFKEMISNISKRLGFDSDIDYATVYRMYQMCRYDKAWKVAQISPWCAVFSKPDLHRLEYAEDLETYYQYGYGSPLNDKIGCSLVKEMIKFFTTHISNELPQQPRALIHLTESSSLLVSLAALMAHRSAPLTADGPPRPNHWTTSTMSPFSGNLAAVLYKCDSGVNYQINDKYQVLLIENEQQLYLDGCRVGLCSWASLVLKYDDLIKNCDGVCSGASNSVIAISVFVISILAKCLV